MVCSPPPSPIVLVKHSDGIAREDGNLAEIFFISDFGGLALMTENISKPFCWFLE